MITAYKSENKSANILEILRVKSSERLVYMVIKTSDYSLVEKLLKLVTTSAGRTAIACEEQGKRVIRQIATGEVDQIVSYAQVGANYLKVHEVVIKNITKDMACMLEGAARLLFEEYDSQPEYHNAYSLFKAPAYTADDSIPIMEDELDNLVVQEYLTLV